MRTTLRSETRSIAIAASPARVHAFMADADNLPTWAPGFAAQAVPGSFAILADAECGTVDIVAATDHSRGAFARVLPNAGGSEVLFTLLFPPEAPESAVDEQMATVDEELAAVRDACQ